MMRFRIGRSLALWLSVLGLMVMSIPVVAAPPAAEVQTTERVTGYGELQSDPGNPEENWSFHVDFAAERWSNSGGDQMWMEVYVEAYEPDGTLWDACGDGAEVDPGLFEEFEGDLSHAFLHSGGEPIAGGLGADCFWGSLIVDTHLWGDGRLLKGNTHQREPGWVCSGHNERRSASVEAHFGFGDGPLGYVTIHQLDRGEPTRGEIFQDVTDCHAKGSPGPAG